MATDKKTDNEEKKDILEEEEDDTPGISAFVYYFILTLSILIILGLFVILELWGVMLSATIEKTPEVWTVIAQTIYSSQQNSIDKNPGSECLNCPITSFCTCSGR
jgi:hypothetical protein